MAIVERSHLTAYGIGVVAMRPIAAGEFLFAITGPITHEQSIYSLQFQENRHIEAGPPANYLNHSCSPAAFLKIDERGMPSVYALRSIACNEQITVDYDTFEYETKVMKTITCQCGSPHCRKAIRGWKYLTAEQRSKLAPYALPYLLQLHPTG